MADIGKILEAAEYCLRNGKCTECKFSKGRLFVTCRYLMEDASELLKELRDALNISFQTIVDAYNSKENMEKILADYLARNSCCCRRKDDV